MNAIIRRPRLNLQIKAPTLRIIDKEGKQIGVLGLDEALRLAREKDLDLVEVAPLAEPPVARIIDFKKYQFLKRKQEQKGVKKTKGGDTKELRFGPHIGPNDLNIRTLRAREFLIEGNKVRLVVRFRGRQKNHPEVGLQKINRAIEDLKDVSEIETAVKQEGALMFTLLRPK